MYFVRFVQPKTLGRKVTQNMDHVTEHVILNVGFCVWIYTTPVTYANGFDSKHTISLIVKVL